MDIENAAYPNSSPQKPSLSPEVIIAGPSSVGPAFNISIAMGLSLVYPPLRLFSDGESKVRIREKLGNKMCIIVQSALPPQVDRHLLQTVMLLKKCIDDSAKDIIAVVPYMAYARQDSVFLEGDVWPSQYGNGRYS